MGLCCMIENVRYEGSFFCTSGSFGRLSDEFRASQDFFWGIEYLDSSPCEVLMYIHCCGVLDGSKDNIYICIPHRPPLLGHQLLEIFDRLAQCVLFIVVDECGQVVEYIVNLVHVLLCLLWVLCPSFRPLLFFLFN